MLHIYTSGANLSDDAARVCQAPISSASGAPTSATTGAFKRPRGNEIEETIREWPMAQSSQQDIGPPAGTAPLGIIAPGPNTNVIPRTSPLPYVAVRQQWFHACVVRDATKNTRVTVLYDSYVHYACLVAGHPDETPSTFEAGLRARVGRGGLGIRVITPTPGPSECVGVRLLYAGRLLEYIQQHTRPRVAGNVLEMQRNDAQTIQTVFAALLETNQSGQGPAKVLDIRTGATVSVLASYTRSLGPRFAHNAEQQHGIRISDRMMIPPAEQPLSRNQLVSWWYCVCVQEKPNAQSRLSAMFDSLEHFATLATGQPCEETRLSLARHLGSPFEDQGRGLRLSHAVCYGVELRYQSVLQDWLAGQARLFHLEPTAETPRRLVLNAFANMLEQQGEGPYLDDPRTSARMHLWAAFARRQRAIHDFHGQGKAWFEKEANRIVQLATPFMQTRAPPPSPAPAHRVPLQTRNEMIQALRQSQPSASQSAQSQSGQHASNADNGSVAGDACAASNACLVCTVAPSSIVLAPCGHVCMCADCAVDLLLQSGWQCPACQQPATATYRVHYPGV